ncbi:MAG: hypothetical protein KDI46_04090 [Alphaproteobacteria bacterium]|nr:hypothetical protein [Alphaproteobacteria bacterium]
MSDLLAEVDEIMRRERIEKIWKEHSSMILSLVIGIIVFTAAISGYKSWNTAQQEKQTAALIALQDAENYPDNILKAEKLNLRPSLQAIALLNAAGIYMQQDKKDEALSLYQRIESNGKIPAEMRNLADLMVIRLSIDKENADAESLQARLKPIWGNPKSPWAAQARIEAAVIASNLQNDKAAARNHLKTVLETENLPESLYAKARALDHVYSLEENKP